MSWPRTPLSGPVTAKAQSEALAMYLEEKFTKPRGGKTLLMESMWHLWEHILESSDEPRVLICCTGEDVRGSFAEQDYWHRVDRKWTIAVLRGHGFRNLLEDEKGQPARKENLTDTIEALRDAVRAMSGLSEEFPINYRGWKNLPSMARPGTANVFVAGATMEFSTANDIPEVTET